MERAFKSTNATISRPTESCYISPHSNADWEDRTGQLSWHLSGHGINWVLLQTWHSRHTPYSPPLYKPGRAPDAPSYTGVKAGAGLPGLPNTAGPGTKGSAFHAWDRPPEPVSDSTKHIPSHNNRHEATGSIVQLRLRACRSREGNKIVSNKPMDLRGHRNSSTKTAAQDIPHAE